MYEPLPALLGSTLAEITAVVADEAPQVTTHLKYFGVAAVIANVCVDTVVAVATDVYVPPAEFE